MKKFAILGGIIVAVPILVGIGIFLAGVIKVDEQLLQTSVKVWFIGTPVSILVLVIGGVILNAMGKISASDNYPDNAAVSEEERDFKRTKNANSSRRSKYAFEQVEDVMRQTNNAHKYSSPKQTILIGLFVAFLIIDFILISVFFIKQMNAGIIICFCVLAGSMFLFLIIAKANERKSIKAKVDVSKSQILCGEVKACVFSSATNIVGRKSVNYRVLIDVDGNTYTAFSTKIYEVGEQVVFAVIGNNRASIIDDEELKKEAYEALNKEDSNDSF
ncbi:MAG: hypothetical protein K2J75_00510 [Clostridia bacterium]|nr:hypothetical protein [Clostridia bacterium]